RGGDGKGSLRRRARGAPGPRPESDRQRRGRGGSRHRDPCARHIEIDGAPRGGLSFARFSARSPARPCCRGRCQNRSTWKGWRREQFDEICAARQAVALESTIARAICLCATPSDGRSNAIARLTNTRDGWIAVLEDEFRAGVVA